MRESERERETETEKRQLAITGRKRRAHPVSKGETIGGHMGDGRRSVANRNRGVYIGTTNTTRAAKPIRKAWTPPT